MIYDIIHGICGAMTAVLGVFNPALAVIAFLAFFVYQIREAQSIGDLDFGDMKEWMVGFFIASGVLIFLFFRAIIIRGVI